MSGWQPIETAPKDGGIILVWDDGVALAWWHEQGYWTEDEGMISRPTHWMPLPKPPVTVASK